jgi:hypothetical protein
MDVDMRDDSSDDGEDEVTTNDSHANSNHAIKNTVSVRTLLESLFTVVD